jgi:hypothetical protein
VSDLKPKSREYPGNNRYRPGLPQSISSNPATKMMDQWDYVKLKSFCMIKEMVSKLKR